jgi:hypothetical protein
MMKLQRFDAGQVVMMAMQVANISHSLNIAINSEFLLSVENIDEIKCV